MRDFLELFFFNDTATTEIYTLSLHDALPICPKYHSSGGLRSGVSEDRAAAGVARCEPPGDRWHRARDSEGYQRVGRRRDRKSTRLNSSHGYISYAVFCLKKKNRPTSQSKHQQ